MANDATERANHVSFVPESGWPLPLENAECGTGNGEGEMADDKWRMADGGWQMTRRNGPTRFRWCQKVGGPFRSPGIGHLRPGENGLRLGGGERGEKFDLTGMWGDTKTDPLDDTKTDPLLDTC